MINDNTSLFIEQNEPIDKVAVENCTLSEVKASRLFSKSNSIEIQSSALDNLDLDFIHAGNLTDFSLENTTFNQIKVREFLTLENSQNFIISNVSLHIIESEHPYLFNLHSKKF